jgi:hypothetical protein
MVTIIDPNPPIKDPCHHFKKEYDNELGLTEAGTDKKFCFGCEPGKQYKIKGE